MSTATVADDSRLVFECREPCTLVCNNVVFGQSREKNIAGVRVYLGGKYAQYDRHMRVYLEYVKLPRQRKTRKDCYLVYLDGLVSFTVEVDGTTYFDTADYFPVYPSLDKAREHREAERELTRQYDRGEITQDEYFERFEELTNS